VPPAGAENPATENTENTEKERIAPAAIVALIQCVDDLDRDAAKPTLP
jgi:hypothetical protein